MDFDEVGYYEPSQAEMILDEFMGKMRDALTGRAKDEIEKLCRENERLKSHNRELRDKADEVETKARQLKEKEDQLEYLFYRRKFVNLLQPFLANIKVYYASYEGHEQPKCPYCDDERNLLFTAENGEVCLRICKCASLKYWYEPKKASLQAIDFYKTDGDGRKFVATAKFESRHDYEEDRYFKAEIRMIVDAFTDEIPELVQSLNYRDSICFTSEEECQKYCDWKNTQDEKKRLADEGESK